jgi:hypothetical protein
MSKKMKIKTIVFSTFLDISTNGMWITAFHCEQVGVWWINRGKLVARGPSVF